MGSKRLELPYTRCQLQQFFCALQWMKTETANFTALMEPLHGFTEKFYERAGNRTKRGVSKILLSALGWSKAEEYSSEKCTKALVHKVTLAHRKIESKLCV